MRIPLLASVIVCVLVTTLLNAGEYNQVLSIGDLAPEWSQIPGTDGKMHSSSDLKDKEAVVVAFTCLSCPTARDYEARIDALSRKYGGPEGKVGIVAVCVNQIPADRLDKLTARATEKKLAFPYLYDETQKIAKDFGATHTPHFFVLNKERRIVYMGAMDDASDPDQVTKRYVEEGLAGASKGESPAVQETLARGCLIRWARERK